MTSVLLSCLIFAAVVLGQLPPWEEQTMYYDWPKYNATITQCRPLQLQWWQISSEMPKIQPPFTWTWYRAGYEPYAFSVGTGTLNKSTKPDQLYFNWTVDLPEGGPYQATVTDAVGANAGLAGNVNVKPAPSGSSCTPIALNQSSLNYTTSPGMSECQTINFQMNNGVPPYTLTVLPSWLLPKKITYAASNWTYVLDIPGNTNVNFLIEDSQGNAVVGNQFQTVSGGTSCLDEAVTLLPQSPGLQTTWPGGLQDSSSTSTSSSVVPSSTTKPISSDTGDNRIALAAGISVGLAVLLLCVLGYAVWRYYKTRRRHVVDLGGPSEFFHSSSRQHLVNPTSYDPSSSYPAYGSRSPGPEDGLLHTGDSSFGNPALEEFNPFTASLYTDGSSSSNPPSSNAAVFTDPYTGGTRVSSSSWHQWLPPGARPPSPASSAGAYQPSFSSASSPPEKALPPKPVNRASPPPPEYSPLLPGLPATEKIRR